MDTPMHPLIREAQAAFSANVLAILKERGMTRADLARKVQADEGPSKKTIYNVLNKNHPPEIKTWVRIAEKLEIPLWPLLLPPLQKHKELMKPGALQGLVSLVEDYLESSPADRDDIQALARGTRLKAKLKK